MHLYHTLLIMNDDNDDDDDDDDDDGCIIITNITIIVINRYNKFMLESRCERRCICRYVLENICVL